MFFFFFFSLFNGVFVESVQAGRIKLRELGHKYPQVATTRQESIIKAQNSNRYHLWSPPRQLNLWQKLRLHAGTLYHSTGEGRRSYLLERCRVLLGRLRHGRISAEEDDVVLMGQRLGRLR